MSYLVSSVQPLGKGRYKIELEEQFPFVLYKGELSKLGIEEGKEISEEEYARIRSDILLKRCKIRAMHLLEKQDRTEAELRKKLTEGLYSEDLIDEVIAFLYSFHYLDDRRYIRNYISYYGRSKSRTEVMQGLMKKGISKEAMEEGFEQLLEEDESVQFVPDLHKIREILHKKGFHFEEADEKEKARFYRMLASKGYRSQDILSAMRNREMEEL